METPMKSETPDTLNLGSSCFGYAQIEFVVKMGLCWNSPEREIATETSDESEELHQVVVISFLKSCYE